MKTIRHAACVLLAAASLLAAPTYATSFSTDQSDLYYIAAESGWGLQLVQRGSVIFATLFVYGPMGQPTWYTATMDFTSNLTWSGTLYATANGTYFESPWNPGSLTLTPVGTMTWQAPFVDSGTLTYVVNGVTVVKNVTRQTLVLDDFSGHYGGGIHSDVSSCANPAFNGTIEAIGILNITQNGTAIAMQSLPVGRASCQYVGTLSQFGQMGEIDNGTYTCTDGTVGTFQVFEMQVNETVIGGRFNASTSSPPGCQQTGWFGGLVVTTF
jgi:hypothetical protein